MVLLLTGLVRTDLGRHLQAMLGPVIYCLKGMMYFFTKSCAEGAQTTIYCAVDESLATKNGRYYVDCAEKEPNLMAKDKKLAKRLWELSEESVGLKKS